MADLIEVKRVLVGQRGIAATDVLQLIQRRGFRLRWIGGRGEAQQCHISHEEAEIIQGDWRELLQRRKAGGDEAGFWTLGELVTAWPAMGETARAAVMALADADGAARVKAERDEAIGLLMRLAPGGPGVREFLRRCGVENEGGGAVA